MDRYSLYEYDPTVPNLHGTVGTVLVNVIYRSWVTVPLDEIGWLSVALGLTVFGPNTKNISPLFNADKEGRFLIGHPNLNLLYAVEKWYA